MNCALLCKASSSDSGKRRLTMAMKTMSNGAVGENRTHDLSLTKGLRYHYATTATVALRADRPAPDDRVRCYNVRISPR